MNREGVDGDLPLQVKDLTKRFGQRIALDAVTFALPEASVCGLVGANGAGKSTLLRCVVGLIRPTAGQGWVFGEPFGTDRAKAQVSFAPDELPMPDLLTGTEFLQLVEGLEARSTETRGAAAKLADVFGIGQSLGKLVGAYSHGMKRRLLFCAAFTSAAPLLILDEPFSGLDVEGAVLLRHALRSWTKSGRTALVTIHDLHTAERECDFIVVLANGRVMAQGSPADIVAESAAANLEEAVLKLSSISPVEGRRADLLDAAICAPTTSAPPDGVTQ